MANSKYRTNIATATATAILLSFPSIGSADQKVMANPAEYRPLDEGSRQLIVETFRISPYVLGKTSTLFDLISEVAVRLVANSKPLDSDFSQVVDREFWDLLK